MGLLPFGRGWWQHHRRSRTQAEAPVRLQASLASTDAPFAILSMDRDGFRARSSRVFEEDALVFVRFTVDAYLSATLPARALRRPRLHGSFDHKFITDFAFATDHASEGMSELVAMLIDAAQERRAEP
jgi:hypothetical protein